MAGHIRTGLLGLVIGLAGLVVTAFSVLVLTRVLDLGHPYFIPSESMKPTLLIGDYLIATPTKSPERGDVLVFRHPVNGNVYISRLIGLSGDRVQMRDGVVLINDTPAAQDEAGEFVEVFEPQGVNGNLPRCANDPVGMGAECRRDRLVEKLPNGRSHEILNSEDASFPDNTDAYNVPEGSLFFLGDNRDNSMDSRFSWQVGGPGFVPEENVLGRARVIVFSSAGTSLMNVVTWRADRYLRWIE
jgi:signal peptidase I